MELIKKVLLDSLTNIDGQFSSKKLTMFVSFILCCVMGLIDQFTAYKINEVVFYSFLMMAGGQSVLSVMDRKIENKDKETNKG